MQRDFQINALRTKTKYKLTSLRMGMKAQILTALKGVFEGVSLGIPLVKILEGANEGDSERKQEKVTVEAGGDLIQPANEVNNISNEVNTTNKEANTIDKEANTINPEFQKKRPARRASVKTKGLSSSAGKTAGPPILAVAANESELSLGFIKLPGLKRYKENSMENSSIVETPVSKPRLTAKVEIQGKRGKAPPAK